MQIERQKGLCLALGAVSILGLGANIWNWRGQESYEEAIRRKLSETGIVTGPTLLPLGQINGISYQMEIICPDSLMDEANLQLNLQQQLKERAKLLIKSKTKEEMIIHLTQQAEDDPIRLIAACLPR